MFLVPTIGLLTLVSSVLADVTYNVVAFPDIGSNTFAVEVDKKLYPLHTSADIFPLWTAKVAGVTAASGYRYVQLNKKKKVVEREEFERHIADKDATATLNEFFNREYTITNLPPMKQIYEDVRPEPSKAFNSSQIGTIHLTTQPKEFADILDNPLDKERKPIKAGFRFINADTIYSVGEAKLSVSGNSSRRFQKVSLRVKFNDKKGETFFDRPIIKLRAEASDASMIREKLYLDLLNSVGVPIYQGSYVRVYVNGESQGLFLMVEDIEEPFLMNTVHHGTIKDKKELGSLYQMGLKEAPMIYLGESASEYGERVYKNKIRGAEDKNMKQWIAFLKDIQDWDPDSPEGIAYWKERLDLDGFLRSMALEYLTGAWDGFWSRGHNYFMYYNPQRKVWQFLPTDFDHTFYSGNRPAVDMTYKEFGKYHAKHDLQDHPLVTKLIVKNKDINKEFETILATITKEVFNSKVLDERIAAYEKQIEKDVEWDLSIDRTSRPGKSGHRSVEIFHKAMGHGKKKIHGLRPWISYRSKIIPAQIAV
ncbi:hypothetical protein BGW42_005288 [Actinomortierella wolfii]|nr:hypothetical protein BGW42_005288 [Actinomortierella wolfii]